jgi:hypothetical protein
MKKTSLIRFVLFSLILPIFFSCSNEYEINSMQDKLNQAEANIDKLTEDEWVEIQKEVSEFKEFFMENRDKLTNLERKKANKCLGKYKLLLIKKGVNDFKEDLIDVSEQIDGLLGEGDK